MTDTPTPTGAAGGDDTTSGSGPGFGVVGSVAALGAGALARRLRDDEAE
jgi:PGF-CTERM protein